MINWDNIDHDYKIFEDPIHGYIKINSNALQFIDTRQFQRLRYLKQLGTLSYIFHSANHTRFEHSIGVGYLSGNLLLNLKKDQPELEITNKYINIVQLSGLLHDIGHGPFSHIFDSEFIPLIYPTSNYKHEQMSNQMIEYLIDDNNIDIEQSDINLIKNIIDGPKNINNRLNNNNYLYEIVANSTNCIDVDKFDYLSRDMYYLFGSEKSYNFNRIFKYNRIIDNTICYNSKITFDIYNLFQQRYLMHKQIYNHKTGKGIEYMICDILLKANNKLKIAECIYNPEEFINLTDDILNTIKISKDPDLKESKDIITRLEKRDIYKFIDEYIVPNELTDYIKIINPVDIISQNSELSNLITIDDIIIFDKKMNYNLNDKNPVDNVYFYNIKNKDYKYKKNKENISLLLPDVFEERIIRIYSKINNVKINNLLKIAFNKYIKQHN
jgi:HD superfamily phosphohydrolase